MTTQQLFQLTAHHDGVTDVHQWWGTDAADAVDNFGAYLDSCASIPHVPWVELSPGVWAAPLPEVHGTFTVEVTPL